MRNVERIPKNTMTLITVNIANKLLGFLFIMYIARYLGAGGFGILSFAVAFTGIFRIFTDLWLNTLMIREVAREKSLAGKYLGHITTIKVLLFAIIFGLTAAKIHLLRYPAQTVTVVYLVVLSVLLLAFANMFKSLFRAFEHMEYEAVGGVLWGGLLLLGALWGIHEGFTVIEFSALYVVASATVVGFEELDVSSADRGNLGFVTQESYTCFRDCCNSLGKLLNGLINLLRKEARLWMNYKLRTMNYKP